MSASKVVTAAFGPAPPPAPVSRATGTLTVDPTAGGTASGLSGAIACPPDCTETVAQGTPFGLTAVPQPGFAFDHWEGACAGAAACSGAVGAKTYVKAVFVGLAPKGRPAATDTDHDGIADARDACPSSPRRSKGASGGCSTTDVVRDPSATLAPLRARLSRARLGLKGVPGMQPVLRGLAAVGRLLTAADTLVTAGDPCGASRQLRSSAASLRSFGARAAKLVAALESSVFAQRLPPGFGDVGDKDVRVAELQHRMRLLDDAVAFGRSAAKAFATTCKTFEKKVVLRGRVTSTDDVSGLVRLNTGRQLLLPARKRFGNRFFEGAVVKVTGKGGSGQDPVLTTEVTTVGSSTSPSLKVVPCMTIRIAPVQDFSVPSPVLHQTGGYLKNGVLQLEGGMRVAAGPKCPAAKSGRYSLAVELLSGCVGNVATVGAGVSGIVARKIAATLTSTGTPAIFVHPADALHGGLGVIGGREVIVAVSNSGETEEVLALLPYLRTRDVPVIAIVGNMRSKLAAQAAVAVEAHAEREAGHLALAPTSSVAVALAVADALALTVMERKGITPEGFALNHPSGRLGRRLTLRVRDVMHPVSSLPVVSPSMLLLDVVTAITEGGLGAVPILSGGGRLAGLVTDGDVRRALQHCDISTLGAVQASDVIVALDAMAYDALRLMEDRPSQIAVLPVVEDGCCAGLLRLHDLARIGL